ncbi:efflux RND transporter periplasmic adaptor subunit [Sedimenticola hydrogenitrophicus]|uniref:efflux RND transporter periplasmic adaptor subunit n=1 Tax=Sedimenticola hydrogenitrophicus TaxID=2967975 RepID=UPI0023B0FEB2|nr:efflux RND transporter periplasmic adaptor subunit [Sedimenticola hydrogenitrophicus]
MIKRLIIVLLLFGAAAAGVGYWKFQQFQQMNAQLTAPRPPAVIASARVRQENWQPMLRAVGSLRAQSGIEITNEVPGMVSLINFDSGQQVTAGEALLRLEDSVELATLESLKADQRLAEVQFRRTAELMPKQAVSKSEFDIAKATYESAQAKVAQQQATVRKKVIRAPFVGILGIRQVDQGQYLPAGTPIVSLQALDPLYVDYALPEREFSRVAPGQVVRLRVAAYPDAPFSGRVSAIDAGVDEGSRSIRVRATVPNPDQRLRPGMFAEVETLMREEMAVLTVPRTAISYNTYGNFAYVIGEAEGGGLRVQRRQVETGAVREGRVAVIRGLAAGERVVRAGLVKLRDGQPVTIDDSVELDDSQVVEQ